jgi:hypothetical protein
MTVSTTITRRCFAGCGALAAAALFGIAPSPAAALTMTGADRKCGTCQHWRGARTLAADKRSVTIADGTKGMCGNSGSPMFNKETSATQVFNGGYAKWGELA